LDEKPFQFLAAFEAYRGKEVSVRSAFLNPPIASDKDADGVVY
jgi:hypothetical protein